MQEALSAAPPLLEVLPASPESEIDSWGMPENQPRETLSPVVVAAELAPEVSEELSFESDLDSLSDAPARDAESTNELNFAEFDASEVAEVTFAAAEEGEETDTELEGKVPVAEEEPAPETLTFEEPAVTFDEQTLAFEETAEEPSAPLDMELDFNEPEEEQVAGELLDFSEANPDEPGYALEEPIGFETPAESAASQNPFAEMEGVPSISAASSALKRKKKESSFLGSMVGIVGGGVIAVPLALFVVIWIRGPEGDVAGMGQYLPSWMLPAAFNQPKSSASVPLAMSPTPTAQDLEEVKQAANQEPSQTEPAATDPEGDEKPKQISDPDAASADPFGKPLPFAEGGEEALPMKESETAADLAADLASEDLASDLAAPTIPLPRAAEIPGAQPADTAPAATAKPAAEPSFDDDIFAPEPTETPATPEPAADKESSEVGLKNPPSYTAEQLSSSFKELTDLRAALLEATSAESRKPLRTAYYMKFYDLAEMIPFTSGANETVDEVVLFLQDIAGEPKNLVEMNLFREWFSKSSQKRDEESGILVAGKVEEVSEKDGMYRIRLLTIGKESPLSVYSLNKPDLAVGDVAVVLGSIVVNPQEAMHQFSEDTAPVVWQGLSLKAGK